MELTVTEQTELESLETIINQNVGAFYKVGCALAKIRDSRLYRETYDTFEDYCKDRWDMTRDYSYKLIGSSQVIENLGTIVPTNEAQTRPLTKLKPERQREAWERVVETAPEGKITARYVSKVVSDIKKDSTVKKVKKNEVKAQSINKEELIDHEVQATWDAFYYEIQRAKMENWKNTSKEAALYLVELTKDLIEIT